ncbi:hypothetical protein [Nocardia vaccinii]|uniref:hypothetical protein n=1 Tax=Nocardia vaccinii TaxID=1822 RepID=UPI000833991E|nr:hypothetical protein [Nocardia vaccinii]
MLISVAAASGGIMLSTGIGAAAPAQLGSSGFVQQAQIKKQDPGDGAIRIFNSEQECRANETSVTICIPYRAGTWALVRKGAI